MPVPSHPTSDQKEPDSPNPPLPVPSEATPPSTPERPTECAEPRIHLAFLSVPPGGEAILIRELAELGLRARTRAPGEVQFRGDRVAIERVAREVRCGTDLRLREGVEELAGIIGSAPKEPPEAMRGDPVPRVIAALALRALRSLGAGAVRVLPGSGETLEHEARRGVRDGATGNPSRAAEPASTTDAEPPLLIRAFSGDEGDPTALAALLAAQLREHRRARHAVLSRVGDLDARVGRTAARRWKFGSADSAWTLCLFDPLETDGDLEEAAGAFRGRPPEAQGAARPSAPRGDPAEDEKRFPALLAENAWLRRRWPERQHLDCYRLYDRDLATVPWAVDRYADALHITIYPPAEGESASAAAAGGKEREARLLLAAGAALGAEPERIFVKRKGKRPRGVQHEVVGRERHTRIVVENGLRILVNLSDYVDTGLFLDQRLARGRVREEARGKRFLNLFCYTASFTVAAAAGGAVETVSVDTSQVYLDWARENLRLNRLDGGAHQLLRKDVMKFLREHPPGVAYDLAFVDPPTTSIQHGEPVWDIQRDHAELLALLRPLITDGGTVLFSTNFRAFRLERELPGWMVEETTPASIPADFRDRKVHRAFRLTAVGEKASP